MRRAIHRDSILPLLFSSSFDVVFVSTRSKIKRLTNNEGNSRRRVARHHDLSSAKTSKRMDTAGEGEKKASGCNDIRAVN